MSYRRFICIIFMTMFGSQSNGSKAICQFHLRGQCKHGSRCWNIHQERGTGTVFGGSSTTQGLFSSFDKSSSSAQDKSFLEFIKQVGVEMNSWEKNGMWLLSSLAPLKDHPILAGFSDTSPEELRVEAYEALKKNDPISYQTKVKEKLEFHKNLRQSLRNQTPEAIAALRAVFYKNGDTATASSMNAFGKTTPSVTSLFGKSSLDQPLLFGGNAINQTSNAFANTNTNQTSSLFGNSGSSANSSQSTSIFGGASNLGSNQPACLFGATNSSHGQNQSNLFGTSSISNAQNQSTSLFGGISNSSGSVQSTNIFGASGNATAVPNPTASQFGVLGNSTGSTGIFGAKPQSGIFGAAPIFGSLNSSGPSTFKAPAGESIFGSQSNTVIGSTSSAVQGSSLFGNNLPSNSTNASLFNSSQSAFGGSSQTPLTNSLFGLQSQASSSLFGNLSNASTSSAGGTTFGSSAPAQGTQSFIGGGDQSRKTSLFTSAQPITTQNVVGLESQGSLLGSYPTQGAFNVFGSSNTNNQATANFSNNNASEFGEQINHNSSTTNYVGSLNSGTLFGKNSPAVQPGNTFYGGSMTAASGIQQPVVTNNTNLFGSGNPPVLTSCSESSIKVYTPLHLVSEEDRIEFERDIFLKIPLVPPPKELCFG